MDAVSSMTLIRDGRAVILGNEGKNGSLKLRSYDSQTAAELTRDTVRNAYCLAETNIGGKDVLAVTTKKPLRYRSFPDLTCFNNLSVRANSPSLKL